MLMDRASCAQPMVLVEPDTGLCVLGPAGDPSQAVRRLAKATLCFLSASVPEEMTNDFFFYATALVVGGGFPGMAAAIELRKRGVQVDLVEIIGTWRRSYGAGISLSGATLRAENAGITRRILEVRVRQ
jgi:hypothetical protein